MIDFQVSIVTICHSNLQDNLQLYYEAIIDLSAESDIQITSPKCL